ncbi:MAG: DUF2970 domain-containing protein [Pseudomonadota bacterium]
MSQSQSTARQESLGPVEDETLPPLSFREMLQSTFAAAIGVQNSANRKRDFTRGNWVHFVYMGIGFTTFFVLLMLSIVHLVLSTS